ncbi:enoyl-CoA hydratase/isomerase family protein [Novosphingobium mangrovi (ex Huang et al. 2023)]|uniref:Enoyl-CoA hydratase/isomerase family protein n=1 Tax=Novosphingobium mangrovi (ex Huang et al. 2023) TaxID=2976432 RepID=A0ABT2I493_9SPHN|nr:enoyl-CoA hydratase/isomerase family protein [Novosphingobium mangrovi (ex Huang et al. 2023)]MCT2399632.1 enoyl-CoA hydratase/isomerase family protein [Novosphingobium mangrovi (ex Huang et al. 2023)]
MAFEVSTKRHGNIGEIHFSAPPHNFASPPLLGAIADSIDAMDADSDIRCILLTAEGRSFCGGANLAGDESVQGSSGMDEIGRLYENATRIFRRKKPMVAAVQGAAIGAGLGLALTADFRIATHRARFSANFVKLGFHPGFALTYTLPRMIGVQRAGWMMLSGDRVKAEEALGWGLVDRIADEEDFEAAALAMAGDIACNAPLALVSIRATLTAEVGDRAVAAMTHEHEQQTALKGTADYEEGVAAVFARRPAVFTGR